MYEKNLAKKILRILHACKMHIVVKTQKVSKFVNFVRLKKKTRILYFNFLGSHKKMNNALENLASHEKLQQICNFLVANR